MYTFLNVKLPICVYFIHVCVYDLCIFYICVCLYIMNLFFITEKPSVKFLKT